MKKKPLVTQPSQFDKTELVLYALVSLVPWAFWPSLAAPTSAKLPIITVVTGLLLLAVSIRAGLGRLPRVTTIVFPLVATLGWKFISAVYGGGSAGVEPLAEAVVYTIVFVGVVSALSRPNRCEKLLSVASIAAVPVCLIGVMEHFGIRLPGVSDIYDGRIYSTLGNPTFLAAYLGLLLPVQLGLFLLADSGRRRWLFGLAASLSFLCVIWTYTRGIWAGLAFALPVMLALVFIGPGRDILKRRGKAVASLALALLLLTGVAWLTRPSASHWSKAKVESTQIGARRSDILRKSLIGAGIQMFRDHPLLGVGLGGYQVHYLEYIRTKPILGPYSLGQDHAHNEFAEVAAEQGIPGLAIYIWLLVAIVVTVIRGLKRTRAAGDARAFLLIAGITAGLIAFSADTMVNVSLHEVHIAVFYWLLLGMLSALAAGPGELTAQPRPKPQRVLLAVFGLTGLIVFSTVGIKALLSDVYTYNASLAQKNADWESAGKNSEYALKHNPFSPIPLYWLGIAYREAGYPEESLRALQLYQSRYPHANRIDFELGRTCFALGDYRRAAGSYREAVKRDPADFPAWQGLAASLYLTGSKNDAYSAATKAVELGADEDAARGYGVATIPRSPGRSRYLIASEMIRAGLYKQAIPELELSAKAEPGNAEFLTTLGAALWKAGRVGGAEESLKAAIVADPGSAQPHGYLGMVYLQTSRKAQARQELLRAISLSSDAQSKATYEALLQQAE